jgi:hypothetical protein
MADLTFNGARVTLRVKLGRIGRAMAGKEPSASAAALVLSSAWTLR